MIPPTDPLALDLGLRRQQAIDMAQAWNAEAIRLGELVWDYAEARGWERLELTFNGIHIAPDDGFGCDLCWAVLPTEEALAQHKADEKQKRYEVGRC